MAIVSTITNLLQGGLGNLAAYLAAHVLLCLLPAFFIAGGLSALVPREAVTRYLGPDAQKYISYPAAALGGFVLAVCSCTIMPIFAGIYKKGAGLGPAITFLFVGPAINILALTYTGVALGLDIAVARLVLSIVFGIGIGLIMALLFRERDDAALDSTFGGSQRMEGRVWLFLLLLLALLIVGTLQVQFLTGSLFEIDLPMAGLDRMQAGLDRLVPYDASQGQEGVSVQGLVLISALIVIAITGWLGLNKVDEGYNAWTWVTLGLVAVVLVVASLGVTVDANGALLQVRGKTLGVVLIGAALLWTGSKLFEDYEIQDWLWESWRFVKQIFPLLIVGVFAVGVLRGLIRPEWIQTLAGSNTVLANLVGVLFGVFMYFPTLVEVSIANMFRGLGMHRGPLLAYLMSDPELSLQSILITSKVIGKRRAWAYVGWVTLFSTLAGLIYGAWVNGTAVWQLALYLALGIAALGIGLALFGKRREATEVVVAQTSHGD